MSMFRDMYALRAVESQRAFVELERMLSEAIQRGFVREIPVTRQLPEGQLYPHATERWFLDIDSGEIYSLSDPGERSCGQWNHVEFEEIQRDSEKLQ